MRQLITRLDDDLHRRIKEKAAAEGRSVNAFVVAVLAQAVNRPEPKTRVRERARAQGRLVIPLPPRRIPSLDEVAAATRGAGSAASDALAAERARR